MLKVSYIAFDSEYNEFEDEMILPDHFDFPNVALHKLYIADFIKYWKSYNSVQVIYTQETKLDKLDKPTEQETLIAKSKIEHQEGLTKYRPINTCPLCDRGMPKKERSKHHLIPVSESSPRGKKAIIHRVCHVKIHSLFTEEELALKYNTIEKLKEHPEMQKFIKWIKNKADNFYTVSRRKKSRSDKKYKTDLI